MIKTYDKIIIGAGIYGMYASIFSAKKGEKVLLLEYDKSPFSRATYVNQTRVHNGYHYPRSYSTAVKSQGYFKRFNSEFAYAINRSFKKVYAVSSTFSWTSGSQFAKFCANVGIRCDAIDPEIYFASGVVEAAFETEEFAFDAMVIKDRFLKQIDEMDELIDLHCGVRILSIKRQLSVYSIHLEDGTKAEAPFLLNVTYASTNQITCMLGYDLFKIKYELCEIILCKPSAPLRDVGLTVMDGPFFSVMPFGFTGLHSLTSVTFTPHMTSNDNLPTFSCQHNVSCSSRQLDNCNLCPNKPKSAWNYLHALARKYIRNDIMLAYEKSLFSIKPVLMVSEIDDSRPTVIRRVTQHPTYVSVLPGKINTVYDLEEVL